VQEPPPVPGWLGEGARALLTRELSGSTRLVVELGAWVGLSTRLIADRAPKATIITIDHWKGSPEHQRNPEWKAMLPALHETFLALCWEYRHRLIPLRMTTLDGLRQVADHGIEPDLIFVDAEHSYQAVSAELEMIHHLFPLTVVVGDEYDWDGVAPAVADAAARHGWTIETAGEEKRGRGWRLSRPEPSLPTVTESTVTAEVVRLDESAIGESGPVVPAATRLATLEIDPAAVRVESHEPGTSPSSTPRSGPASIPSPGSSTSCAAGARISRSWSSTGRRRRPPFSPAASIRRRTRTSTSSVATATRAGIGP